MCPACRVLNVFSTIATMKMKILGNYTQITCFPCKILNFCKLLLNNFTKKYILRFFFVAFKSNISSSRKLEIFFFHFRLFFIIFCSLWVMAILHQVADFHPARDCQITLIVKMMTQFTKIKQISPNFLKPTEFKYKLLEIFCEIFVHMATPTKFYFKKVFKKP